MKDINDVVEYMVKNKINPLKVDSWYKGERKVIYQILDKCYNSNCNEIVLDKAKIYIYKKILDKMENVPKNEYTISILFKF